MIDVSTILALELAAVGQVSPPEYLRTQLEIIRNS